MEIGAAEKIPKSDPIYREVRGTNRLLYLFSRRDTAGNVECITGGASSLPLSIRATAPPPHVLSVADIMHGQDKDGRVSVRCRAYIYAKKPRLSLSLCWDWERYDVSDSTGPITTSPPTIPKKPGETATAPLRRPQRILVDGKREPIVVGSNIPALGAHFCVVFFKLALLVRYPLGSPCFNIYLLMAE